MRLLEGHITEADPRDAEIESLHADIRQLQQEVRLAQTEAARARRDATSALAPLRKQLTPLYRALQAVFGELDAAGVPDDAPTTANPRTSAVWDAWKAKIGGQAAQIIDGLLLHRDMTAQQIAIHIGIHKKNVPQLIYKLNKAGLIAKIGDRYSLKQL